MSNMFEKFKLGKFSLDKSMDNRSLDNPLMAPNSDFHAPQSQAPQDQAPQDQAPQDQAPQDQAPQDQAPQDQAPQGQVPEFQSVEELVQFFETQDMGGLLDQLTPVNFQVGLKTRKFLVAVDEALVHRLAAIAQTRRLTIEDLIDLWIREKLSDYPPI